ncbi:unnamed protein product [Mytilus coruscus]|uniref:CCHC-type domain-containing protein n=1 Tax=Mytilus coruscus TaxID=42192 RepID=A0A6J8EZL5_MYTCO|nr:unnamed protein product [Mytilus coruscus]
MKPSYNTSKNADDTLASGEDLALKVTLLRDKISSTENDRFGMVVSFQLQADRMREKNLAIIEEQRLKYEQERELYLQKKVISDRELNRGVSYRHTSTSDNYGPSAPKLATFDGKDTKDVKEQEEERFAVRLVEKEEDNKRNDLAEIKIIVKKILNMPNQNHGQRSRSPYRSPTPVRSKSPNRGMANTSCYQCGKEEHYARDCPNRIIYQNGSPMQKSKTLSINLTLDGRKVLAVVNSDAQTLVISTSFLRQLGPKVKMKQHILWKRVRDGSQAIFGLGNKEGEFSHVYRVTVTKKTIVPPQSMNVLKIEIDRTPNTDIAIPINYELNGLLTLNVVLKRDQEVITITDVNEIDRFTDNSSNDFEPMSDTDQPAEADRISATLTANPKMEEYTSKDSPEYSILSIKSDKIHDNATVNPHNPDKNMSNIGSVRVSVKPSTSDKQITQHLQDLYIRTIKDMTPSESKDIDELLCEFQDVFAKGDMNLGLFEGEIKHRIHMEIPYQ